MTRNYQHSTAALRVRLNPEKVRYILRNMDTKNASLDSELNVNEASIEHVKHRRCWAWVTLWPKTIHWFDGFNAADGQPLADPLTE